MVDNPWYDLEQKLHIVSEIIPITLLIMNNKSNNNAIIHHDNNNNSSIATDTLPNPDISDPNSGSDTYDSDNSSSFSKDKDNNNGTQSPPINEDK